MQNPMRFIDFWGLSPGDIVQRTVNVTQGNTLAIRSTAGGTATGSLQRGEQVNIRYVPFGDRPTTTVSDGTVLRWVELESGGWIASNFLSNLPPLFIFHGDEDYTIGYIDRNMPLLEDRFVVVRHTAGDRGALGRAWNASPENMANVVMLFHGSPNDISTINPLLLPNLNVKTIHTLIMLSCNNAHRDVSNNIAELFFARNNITQMIAFDGAFTITSGTAGTTTLGRRGAFERARPADSTRQPLGMIRFAGNMRIPVGTTFYSIDDLLMRLGR